MYKYFIGFLVIFFGVIGFAFYENIKFNINCEEEGGIPIVSNSGEYVCISSNSVEILDIEP